MSVKNGCWDGCHPLQALSSTAPKVPGLYAVYWAAKSGLPRSVRRAAGDDHAGFLYIGSTHDLCTWISNNYCSTTGQPPATGQCFACNHRYYNAKRLWPYAEIWVRWAMTDDWAHKEAEYCLGEEYFKEFLGLPPLNCKLPGTAPKSTNIPAYVRKLLAPYPVSSVK